MKKIALAIVVVTAFFQCKFENEKLEVFVLDENKKAIANCNVLCNLWKNAVNSEETLSKFSTKTDDNGFFTIELKDVIHLDLIIQSKGYIPYIKKGYYPKIRNKLEVLLVKSESAFNAKSSIYNVKDQLKIGIELEETPPSINYKSIKDSIPNSNISIWIELEDSNFKKLVITTNSSFGILPIYENDEGSLLYKFRIAPNDGYVKKHLIDGNEKGYFIKSNFGFAKIILKNQIVEGTYPKNNNYVKYKHQFFDWIYNNTNDLSVNYEDIEKILQ